MSGHRASLLTTAMNSLPSCLEDLPIEHQDHKERNVECGARGEDLVGHVLAYETPLLEVDAVQIVRILPAELWCQRDYKGYRPDDDNHDANPCAITCVNVVHVSHGPVPETKICLR